MHSYNIVYNFNIKQCLPTLMLSKYQISFSYNLINPQRANFNVNKKNSLVNANFVNAPAYIVPDCLVCSFIVPIFSFEKKPSYIKTHSEEIQSGNFILFRGLLRFFILSYFVAVIVLLFEDAMYIIFLSFFFFFVILFITCFV